MKPGPFIRRLFGPYEHRISEIYRAIFLDIDVLVDQIARWELTPARILEVGCGEGAVTERLRAAYPAAEITATDISVNLGRLYVGDRTNLRFIRCAANEIAVQEPAAFDLVILSDVLHHVPLDARQPLISSIRQTMAPGAAFVFKDWERNSTPIHWMSYLADRWLTGDRISYVTRQDMRELVDLSFGAGAIVAETRIAPWRNNLALLIRPSRY